MTEKQTSDALALGRIRAVIDILQTINNIQTTESIVVRIHDILARLQNAWRRSTAHTGNSLIRSSSRTGGCSNDCPGLPREKGSSRVGCGAFGT
jgi:hypothetical protein